LVFIWHAIFFREALEQCRTSTEGLSVYLKIVLATEVNLLDPLDLLSTLAFHHL
jgi:hypothetical protein